jgi:CubicO group peptidase (beta-lactamase class C family)
MRIRFVVAPLLSLGLATSLFAQTRFPAATWEKTAPETAGWDVAKLNAAFAYADSIGSKAIFIVQNGQVIADRGNTAERYHVFSIRKSFQSALIGMLIAEGQLKLESTLAELGIDDHPPSLTPDEKRATVRDLIMARSGVFHSAAYETPGMMNNRPARGSHAPGTFHFYNNWDFNALVTISERASKRNQFELFEERIAKPLQMEDFRMQDTELYYDSMSQHPAQIYRMSARDLARFGLLYLNDGKWRDKQIVPAAWVRESLQPYSDLDIRGGYGYMWWVALRGGHFPFVKMPDGTFSARGTGEQVLLVVPAWNLVLVHRTDYELQRRRQRETGVPARMMRVTEFGRLLQRILAARRT